jgi:cytochrome c-type biogenesis protein CcmH
MTAVALLAASLAFGAPIEIFQTEDYLKASKTILCDCGCHPQSVYDCACGRADQMRNEVADKVASGMSGDEVIDWYVEQYGEQIRVAPTATGFNLVAWLGPALGFLGAGAGLVLILRRWNRRPPDDEDGPATPTGDAGDDPYRERLKSELEDLDR